MNEGFRHWATKPCSSMYTRYLGELQNWGYPKQCKGASMLVGGCRAMLLLKGIGLRVE